MPYDILLASTLSESISKIEQRETKRSAYYELLTYYAEVKKYFLLCCCCLPCTIEAIGHGLLKKFWPFGTRLRSTHCREFNYLKLCRPAYFIRTTQLLPHPHITSLIAVSIFFSLKNLISYWKKVKDHYLFCFFKNPLSMLIP